MKISEIVASLKELQQTVATFIGDKTKATSEALSSFQSKLSSLEAGALAELNLANTKLSESAAAVTTLTAEKTDLEGKLSAAQASVTSLTAEKAKAVADLEAQKQETAKISTDLDSTKTALASANGELSKVCIAANCVELKDADGKPLAKDASEADKVAAADKISFAEKMKAYQGAVNAAVAKAGVSFASLPAGAPSTGGANPKSPANGCAVDSASLWASKTK